MTHETPIHWKAVLALMKRLPKSLLSRGFGHIADIGLPRFLRRPVLGTFAHVTGINLSEAEMDLEQYPSLSAFFVRNLRRGVRPIPVKRTSIISPVDGALAEWGRIEEDRLIQAKGIHYRLEDLLDDKYLAHSFQNGFFMTIYLSPRDYHRIHAPFPGDLNWARCVPGTLFPVNAPAVALIPDLFARNERLIVAMQSPMGRTAVVAVGAFNVGRISAHFDKSWNHSDRSVTSHKRTRRETRTYEPAIPIERGEEIMAFHLGSTVVMLFEPDSLIWSPGLKKGMKVFLGQELAEWVSPTP
jgi:phosphatidylserine decarboxylase